MGTEKSFTREKLVVGMLISREELRDEVERRLCSAYGPMDLVKGPFPFDFTDYYDEEMDRPIMRWFYSFRDPVDPSRLADIKLFTNRLEEELAREGKRKVNLDPGLLALSRFVLATTKDNAHRIPLREGIFAEVTLLYRRKDFEVLEWTYPDYRSRTNRDVLREIRELYKKNLAETNRG